MTNGDVIKKAFPNSEIKHDLYGIEGIPLVCLCLHTNTKTCEASFIEEWWNAPYKERRTVNSQPKTGYWIKTPNGFKCSRCLIVRSHTSIFCPSCGAKMIASPESEGKE